MSGSAAGHKLLRVTGLSQYPNCNKQGVFQLERAKPDTLIVLQQSHTEMVQTVTHKGENGEHCIYNTQWESKVLLRLNLVKTIYHVG